MQKYGVASRIARLTTALASAREQGPTHSCVGLRPKDASFRPRCPLRADLTANLNLHCLCCLHPDRALKSSSRTAGVGAQTHRRCESTVSMQARSPGPCHVHTWYTAVGLMLPARSEPYMLCVWDRYGFADSASSAELFAVTVSGMSPVGLFGLCCGCRAAAWVQ